MNTSQALLLWEDGGGGSASGITALSHHIKQPLKLNSEVPTEWGRGRGLTQPPTPMLCAPLRSLPLTRQRSD